MNPRFGVQLSYIQIESWPNELDESRHFGAVTLVREIPSIDGTPLRRGPICRAPSCIFRRTEFFQSNAVVYDGNLDSAVHCDPEGFVEFTLERFAKFLDCFNPLVGPGGAAQKSVSSRFTNENAAMELLTLAFHAVPPDGMYHQRMTVSQPSLVP